VISQTSRRIPRPQAAPGCRRVRGATFIELMLAVLVISTTVVGSVSSLHSTTEVYHYFADGKHEALMLAQEVHEAALLLPWAPEAGLTGLYGADVDELADLDGMTFSPPRSADYDVVISHLTWSQTVELTQVDLEHPEVEVDPATFEGQTQTQLKVIVKKAGTEVGSFTWWLSEPTHD
jgi:hypothetical protein